MGKDRRRWLSDLFILAGLSLLFGAGLFWARDALATRQTAKRPYLVSRLALDLPLPTLTSSPTPLSEAAILTTPAAEKPASWTLVEAWPIPITEIAASSSLPASDFPPESLQSQDRQAISPAAVKPTLAHLAPLTNSGGSVIRLVIPHIRVDRAVVSIDLIGSGETLQWNTNALLANQNRRDLVGQLSTSVNPGDGGNVILVGHNYNRGASNWLGVFVNLTALTPGDRITVYTQNDGEFHYTVQEVRQVPWAPEEGEGLGEHGEYLWPRPHEQLTLVTCGGINLSPWSTRVYVVALPVGD